MNKLTRQDLYSLERYAELRAQLRAQVAAHKKNRRIDIGPNVVLFFEDRLTIQYQIQEMLRAERIFEAAGIQEELNAYNPLIPDGDNWKATMMIQYPDSEERKERLAELVGIEDRVWLQIAASDKIYAVADEDLERSTDEKTSSVHFLRFQLDARSCADAQAGANIALGIDHQAYLYRVETVAPASVQALLGDLD